MLIDVIIEDPRWENAGLATLAEAAADAVWAAQDIDPDICAVAVMGCDDTRIADLNRAFRDKPVPTNVLSFPSQALAPATPGAIPPPPKPDFTGELALGDIAIAWDTCAREALAAGKPIHEHVTHLVVHGLLHLLGYDHIRDPDATLMQALETRILGKMGLDDPYRENDGS